MVQITSSEQLVAQIDDIGVTETLKAHRKTPLPTRILRDLYELYHDQEYYLEFLAHYPLIPSDLADQMVHSLNESQAGIALGLAANPRCPQQGLNALTTFPDAQVRTALARNVNLTPKEFHTMIADECTIVRAALAENPSLPNPLQFILAADASSTVQIALASRRNLDLDVALHLSLSEDSMVAASVVLQWKQDEELLQYWADYGSERVQLLLLKRSTALSHNHLHALRLANSGIVHRSALRIQPPTTAEMLFLTESTDTRDRSFVANCTDLPGSLQRILAQDPSPGVRRSLASNSTIDPQIALHIAASNDLDSCRSLAKNSAVSDKVISELCAHPEDGIALLVTYRDDLTEAHLDLLINHRTSITAAEHIAYQKIKYIDISKEITKLLAQSESPTVRTFAAQSKNIDDEAAHTLANDPSENVCLALVNNPATKEEILRELTRDPVREIVLAAESALNLRLRVTQTKTTEHSEDSEKVHTQAKEPMLNKIVNFFTD